MMTLWKQVLVLALSAFLFSGCTLSNPNTQTGAGIGAVTGAVIGGNIGDRSGSNIAGATVLGATIGGAVGSATGDSRPQQTGGWE